MPKMKLKKKSTAKKKAGARKSPVKVQRKKKPAAKKKVVKRKAAAKKKKTAAVRKKATKKTRKAAIGKRKRKKSVSLGRPKLTGEALLDQVFKEDYHARQIFTFLRVTTLKELEHYSPEEIIDRLSAPLVQTVQQIRKRLADNNRYLADDLDYALRRKVERTRK